MIDVMMIRPLIKVLKTCLRNEKIKNGAVNESSYLIIP